MSDMILDLIKDYFISNNNEKEKKEKKKEKEIN